MKTFVLIATLLLPAAAGAFEPVLSEDHQVLYRTQGEFSAVKENVRFAIENQGLVINYVAQVGDMLERTGNDLGITGHTYLAADVMEFCSARLTRDMVEADPANLVFCPYGIHLYERTAEPGMIYVGYKRPLPVGGEASRDALAAIDELLDTIVREALAW